MFPPQRADSLRTHGTHTPNVLARGPPSRQVASQRLTLLELLQAFRSAPVTLQSLANLLPRLSPR
jgi:sulfite reductase alpha subunit-like flavoprotein